MTSEVPQQSGWQPAEPQEQAGQAPQQGGFGLFEAPQAPDDFPIFTPYGAPPADNQQAPSAYGFPPDSTEDHPAPTPFSGFPDDRDSSGSMPSAGASLPDAPPPAFDWSGQDSGPWQPPVNGQQPPDQQVYVPAPAVMPIPGVKHDLPSPFETQPSYGQPFAHTEPYAEPEPYSSTSDSYSSSGSDRYESTPARDAYADDYPPVEPLAQREPFAQLEDPLPPANPFLPSNSYEQAPYEPAPYEPAPYESAQAEPQSGSGQVPESHTGTWSAFAAGEGRRSPSTSWTPPESGGHAESEPASYSSPAEPAAYSAQPAEPAWQPLTEPQRNAQDSYSSDAYSAPDSYRPSDSHSSADSYRPSDSHSSADSHSAADSYRPSDSHSSADSYRPSDSHSSADSYSPAESHSSAESYSPAQSYSAAESRSTPDSYSAPSSHNPSDSYGTPEPFSSSDSHSTPDPYGLPPESVPPMPVRAAARVSAPITPPVEPIEVPPPTAKPVARVYGSAPSQQDAPSAEDELPPLPARVPQQLSAAEMDRPVRATARASVSVPSAIPSEVEQLPQIARSSTVYGSPARAAEVASQSAAAGQAGPAPQVYGSPAGQGAEAGQYAPAGTPVSPAPAQGGVYGSPAQPHVPVQHAPAQQYPPAPAQQHAPSGSATPIPVQAPPGRPRQSPYNDLIDSGQPPEPNVGHPGDQQHLQQAPTGQPYGNQGPGNQGPGGQGPGGYGPAGQLPGNQPPAGNQGGPFGPPPPGNRNVPQMIPVQRGPQTPPAEGDQSKFERFKPDDTGTLQAKPVKSGRLITMVVLGGGLLLAIAFGLLIGLDKLLGEDEPTGFVPTVNECVQEQNNTAVAAACTDAGAFLVVSVVDKAAACEDATQPSITKGDKRYCLRPAEAGAQTPAPNAS